MDPYRRRQIHDGARARRAYPEESLHRLVVDWLGWNRNHLRCRVWFHVPNQSASKIARMINAGLGALSGVSDLVLIPDREAMASGARVLFLELKAPSGTVIDRQRAFGQRAEASGHLYRVARTLDEASAAVREAGLWESEQ